MTARGIAPLPVLFYLKWAGFFGIFLTSAGGVFYAAAFIHVAYLGAATLPGTSPDKIVPGGGFLIGAIAANIAASILMSFLMHRRKIITSLQHVLLLLLGLAFGISFFVTGFPAPPSFGVLGQITRAGPA